MSTNYYNLESIESQSYFSHTDLRKLLKISEDKLNNVLTYLHIPFVILKNKNNGVLSKQISKSDYLKIKIFLNETDTNKLFTSITYKNKGITINSLAKELNCDCSKIKISIRYLKLNIKKYISEKEKDLIVDCINSVNFKKIKSPNKSSETVKERLNSSKEKDRIYLSNKYNEDYFSLDNLSILLNLSKVSIRKYIRQFNIKYIKLNNRWWISKTNVDMLNKYYSKDVKSLGEEIVAKYLSSKNIQFIREYKFKNCRDILPLPFDFYIEKSNLIIEVDGVNHIQPVKDFGGDDGFKIIKKHDYIKNEYCKCNNIRLIRLPWYGEVKNKDSLLNNLNRELKLLNITF